MTESLSNLLGSEYTEHGTNFIVFNQLGSNESFAPMAFIYDEDHSAYEEPKLVKWLRARKPEKPYQPNLSLEPTLLLVDGGLHDSKFEKAA